MVIGQRRKTKDLKLNMANPTFKVKEEKIAENHSEFTVEPLEPGYGHTLGNALRRVLLTSIPAAAVTAPSTQGRAGWMLMSPMVGTYQKKKPKAATVMARRRRRPAKTPLPGR